MRWTRWTVSMAVAAVSSAGLYVASCAPPQQQAEMTQEQKVARGKTLVWASACIDCHVPGGLYGAPDTTRMMAGSELGWRGPWGVTYPRNLTPHETGLAGWTEDEIVRAFRQGVRKDGSPVLPPMPWPAYSRMTDEDAYAIAAYLMSLPPVDHKTPDRLGPDDPAVGPEVVFPPPPAWDAPQTPAEEGGEAAGGGH